MYSSWSLSIGITTTEHQFHQRPNFPGTFDKILSSMNCGLYQCFSMYLLISVWLGVSDSPLPSLNSSIYVICFDLCINKL